MFAERKQKLKEAKTVVSNQQGGNAEKLWQTFTQNPNSDSVDHALLNLHFKIDKVEILD